VIALDGRIREDIRLRVMLNLEDPRFVVGVVYRIERAVISLIAGCCNDKQKASRNYQCQFLRSPSSRRNLLVVHLNEILEQNNRRSRRNLLSHPLIQRRLRLTPRTIPPTKFHLTQTCILPSLHPSGQHPRRIIIKHRRNRQNIRKHHTKVHQPRKQLGMQRLGRRVVDIRIIQLIA
jgi:hypothetical protein